jgi:hypothetical protein
MRTGSKEHNIWFAQRAQDKGLSWKPYEGLFQTVFSDIPPLLPCATEESLYRAIGFDYIDPVNRESTWLTSSKGYWWPGACTAMLWDSTDRALRLRVLSQAVGRPLTSASDLKSQTDWDHVKSHLLALSQPANVNDQVRIANQPRTRLLYSIRSFGFSDAYISAVSADRYGTKAWETLTLDQLGGRGQLRDILANRARAQKARQVKAPVPAPPSILTSAARAEPPN